MALPCGDHYCNQFQPNTFDPSRCGSCLRPGHMHLTASTAAGAQQDDDDAFSDATASATSDAISCDWTFEWSLVHTLSPDWELNICDSDTQSSSPDQRHSTGTSGSLSPVRHGLAWPDMTRLDPSPHRASNSSLMDEGRGRDRSRRPSESRGDRQQESGYFSPDRKSVGEQQTEDVQKRQYRHYERGHALPSNHVPDPKACVPYRTVNLGVPSQRRNADTFSQDLWRSESPQRYSYHSNFRRSQENSPTRHYSKSPDRKVTESPPASQRRSSHSRSRPMSQAPSHVPSHAPSRHTSGRSSPSHRRGSNLSRPASPSRASPHHKRTDSSHLESGTLNGRSRESRCASQASNGHSLDSEKLYKNLESISRRGSSAIQPNSYQGSQASPRTNTRNSHDISPSRSGHGTHNYTSQREPRSRDSRPDTTQTYSKRNTEREPHSRYNRPDPTQTYSDRNSEREPRSRDSRPDTTQTYSERNTEREPRSRDSRPDTTQTYSERNSEREPRSRDSRPDTTQTYSERNSEREPRSRDSRPETTQTYSDRNSEREPRSRDSRPDTTQTYSDRNSEREPRSRDSRPDTTQTYSDRNTEREPRSRDSRPDTTQTYSKRNTEREERISPPQASWHGSSHSLLSPTHSHGSSPSRRGVDSELLAHSLHSHAATGVTDQVNNSNNKCSSDRSRSNMARGMGALLTSEPKKSEAAVEEVGMTIDDYIEIADIPKINMDSEEEFQGLRRRTQSPSPRRDMGPRTPRYQDETHLSSSRVEPDERGRGRERGRDRREKYRDSDDGMSRRQSTTSLHSQGSDKSGKHRSTRGKERGLPEDSQMGWMSRLDGNGKWRKHWFVLGDTSLRFYRDSEAESDDLDGEIDLISCVNVSECDVEKNYGFQIHTKRTVFTLSATTSKMRRNWVKLLKQGIQTNTHQSDTGSEKENPLSQRLSSCQPPSRLTCKDSSYKTTRSANSHDHADHYQDDSVVLDLDRTPSGLSPASQREAGEGWDREQAKRLEQRNKWFEEGVPCSEMGSRWDSVELKKGSVPVPVTDTIDSEVNKKWAELERISPVPSPIGAQTHQSNTEDAFQPPIGSQTTIQSRASPELDIPCVIGSKANESSSKEALPFVNGAQTNKSSTAEALQREALSLRQQVESIKKDRVAMGIEMDSPCGPGAPCRAKLEAMVSAHHKALEELQEKHVREIRELEREKDRLLQEESEAATKAMEALKRVHREEVETARRTAVGDTHMDKTYRGQRPQADSLHSELDVLSEHYSQKCLELNLTEQSGRSKETELGSKQREMDQLRKENQELRAKLAEEISRMRFLVTGQKSGIPAHGSTERSASDTEVMLRAKEKEVEYLQKEISCLRSEVQSLIKEKEAAYERYKTAYVELNEMKGRSQLETSSLKEHLRLANAALQEGTRDT